MHFNRSARIRRTVTSAIFAISAVIGSVTGYVIANSTPAHAAAAPSCIYPRHWIVVIISEPGYSPKYVHECVLG